MQKRPTVSSLMLKELLRIAEQQGVDGARLTQEFSLHPTLISDIEARVPLTTISLMHERVAELLDDPMFGLYKGLSSTPFSLGPIMNIIVNSPDVKTALELSTRYIRLFSEEFDFEIVYEGELFGLKYQPNPLERVSYHQVYAAMGHTVSLLRWLYGAGFNISRITFCSGPHGDVADYQRVLGVRPVFNADANVLYMPVELLDNELPWSGGDLSPVLADVDKQLDHIFRNDEIAERVRQIIRAKAFVHNLSIGDVAKELHMSQRTLQRRLKEHQVSYRELLDEVKKDTAFALLSSYKYRNKSLNEVAFMLGYSDLSKFYKDFKRWSGVSPGKYREANASIHAPGDNSPKN